MFNLVLLLKVEYFPIKMRSYGITSFEYEFMVPQECRCPEEFRFLKIVI